MVIRDACKQENRSSIIVIIHNNNDNTNHSDNNNNKHHHHHLFFNNFHQQIARRGWLWLQLEFWEWLLAAQLMFHDLSEHQAFQRKPGSEG